MKKRILSAVCAFALAAGLLPRAVSAGLDSSTAYKSVCTDCCTTLAVTSAGELWAWGDNTYGQVGAGDLEESFSPRFIMSGVDSAVSCGNSSYAITNGGVLYSWGLNESGQLGYWGGTGKVNDYYYQDTPKQVLSGVASITAVHGAAYAIKTDGSLYAWGINGKGQLGFQSGGSTATVSSPTWVMSGVVKVWASGVSAYALTASGELYGWGDNSYGQLGLSDVAARYSPQEIMSGVSGAAVLENGVLILKTDGTVYSCGLNDRGQLGYSGGNGKYVDAITAAECAIQTEPKQTGLTDIAAVAGYGASGYGIDGSGVLWGWGGNSYGQLGTGDMEDRSAPVKIMDGIASVTATNTVYAVDKNKTLWSWGSNLYGQTGTGNSAAAVTEPGAVIGEVKSLSASWTSLSAFAILGSGALYGWGGNHTGQLGFPPETAVGMIQSEPVQIMEREREPEDMPARVSVPSVWAQDEVTAAQKLGIVPDDIQGYYQAYILRVEFAGLIVRTIEQVTGQEMTVGGSFDDTDDISVLKARAAGIVSGKEGNNFDPWNEITREEMAKMIINSVMYLEDFFDREYIIKYTGNDGELFSGVSAWALPYMQAAYATGYIRGDGVSLAPGDSTSCEQAILIVYRAVKNI